MRQKDRSKFKDTVLVSKTPHSRRAWWLGVITVTLYISYVLLCLLAITVAVNWVEWVFVVVAIA